MDEGAATGAATNGVGGCGNSCGGGGAAYEGRGVMAVAAAAGAAAT